MARCRVDPSIERVVKADFAFPLGVYPVEEITPKAGYTTAFEAADGDSPPVGGNEGEWEEWPDRYVYDILVPATRLASLLRSLMSLLPGRIYPIVDFLGQDEWREVDPYVSYDLIGVDRFHETLKRFDVFFLEDGLVGFGAMSEEPFVYIFVDEHKVVTVRVQADMKDKVEGVLHAFDLESVPELLSADSATHEHRTVLEAPDDARDLLNAEEIVEGLRDEWRLVLNIDPDSNVDEEGNELGMTGWRCIVRYDPPLAEAEASAEPEADESSSETAGKPSPMKPARTKSPAKAKADAAGSDGGEEESPKPARLDWPESRYCQVFLTAESLNRAMELAYEGLEQLLGREGKTLDDLPRPEKAGKGDAETGGPEVGEGDDEPGTLEPGNLEPELPEPVVIQADRWGEADFVREVESATGQKPDVEQSAIWILEWLK